MKNFKDAAWKENVTKVIQQIQEQEIKFIRLQFTDINGMLKNLAVSSKNIESIFENGQSFDGSSITGYRPIEESDMVCTQTRPLLRFYLGGRKKNLLRGCSATFTLRKTNALKGTHGTFLNEPLIKLPKQATRSSVLLNLSFL